MNHHFGTLPPLQKDIRFSLHDLDVVELPRAIEGRRLRAVDAEGAEPTFTRDGLDPHAFLASRSLGAEVNVL